MTRPELLVPADAAPLYKESNPADQPPRIVRTADVHPGKVRRLWYPHVAGLPQLEAKPSARRTLPGRNSTTDNTTGRPKNALPAEKTRRVDFDGQRTTREGSTVNRFL